MSVPTAPHMPRDDKVSTPGGHVLHPSSRGGSGSSAADVERLAVVAPLHLRVRLLGGFAAGVHGAADLFTHSQRRQSLIAYLLLHRQMPLSRDRVAYALWPDTSESNARANLRTLLYRLRKEMPDSERFLLMDDTTLRWHPDVFIDLDVDAFDRSLAEAANHQALANALSLYRGELLPGCYEEWILPHRERLHQRYLAGLEQLITLLQQQGEYEAALVQARYLLHAEPLREEGYRRLMRLHALLCDQAGVERVWQECIHALETELDLPPSPALAQSHQRLVKAAATPQHPPLPTQPTPFLGREDELTQIRARLSDPHCRLLTVVGPGGMGKTRLVLQAAQNNAIDFLDGIVFVPLAELAGPHGIATALAAALGVCLANTQSAEAELLCYLRGKEMLLILDNYENVLPRTRLLVRLLAETPGIKLLVTSRERLNLRWEWCLPLQGLPLLTEAERARNSNSAMQLFVQTARRLDPAFTPQEEWNWIAQICRLVGGMPLAIELAASWIRLLSCQQIAEHLRQGLDHFHISLPDVPTRHHSLRAIFDDTWRRLSSQEQQIFAKLTIFCGGFSLRSAEAVAGASLSLLASLVDRSLMRRTEDGRYELHEILRRYGAEKLAQQPEMAQEAWEKHRIHSIAHGQTQVERVPASPSDHWSASQVPTADLPPIKYRRSHQLPV